MLRNPSELSIHFSQTTDLRAPLRPHSDIWKCFHLERDEQESKIRAVCNECHKSLAFTGKTSDMWRHVKRVHCIEK